MTARAALLLSALAFVAGCNDPGSGGGSVAASTAAGSTTPGAATPSGSGPLAQKAEAFEQVMGAQHLGLGQVQDARIDPATGAVIRMGGAPSRCLWTGVYAGAQAMRYRATNDPRSLARLEQALWTLHDLHEITGYPGAVARGFDDPAIETNGWPASGRFAGLAYNKGHTSRDQYAGWFYGIAQGFDHVQDPALRQALQDDVRAVCDLLMANDLKLKTPWGPQGTVETFFSLRPDDFYQDQITPQTWATVDDFPFNLITKSVPYSQPLADAIKQARIPPVRAGEALRAVFFFTVAEHVTGDPRYGVYKRDLLFNRGYLQVIEDYGTILDDIFHGRNLVVVERALRQLFGAIGQIGAAYLQATGKSALVTQLLVPLASSALGNWLAQVVTDLLDWIHNPGNQGTLQRIVQHAQVAALILNVAGQQQASQKLTQALQQYGPYLNHQGLIDFARTVRSHLGTNLTTLPMAAMIRIEPDAQVVARYRGILDRGWYYVQGDHNPIVNLVHAANGNVPGANDVPHSIEALRRFPVDLSYREVDNSNWPGLVVSPWPDRMGRVGNHALVPDYFPIDHRAPDVFPWRGHPRQIKGGSNAPNVFAAPLGYLSAYWLARDLGLVGPND